MINHNGRSFNGRSIEKTGADRYGFGFFNVSDPVIKNNSIDCTSNKSFRGESSYSTLEV